MSRPRAPSSTGSCRKRRSTSRSSQGYFPIFDGVAPPKGYPQVSSLKIMRGDLRDILAQDEENKKRFTDLFGG